jgi:hypothetical protein
MNRKTILWIALAIAAFAIFGTVGGFYVKGVLDKRKVRAALRAAAKKYGVNPDWLDAIAKQESNWDPQARNEAGADSTYGGAYGITQILWTNLVSLGWKGTREQYLADPAAQAEISAKFAANGPKTSLQDFATWWNSGKRTLAQAPASTRDTYVPRVVANLTYVQQNPVA